MANDTLGNLVTEIQALTGRVADTEIVTTARCVRWLNEAQFDAAKYCRGHVDLEYKHPTAITLATDTYSYSLASLSPALLHFLRAHYLDGDNSRELEYVATEDFDKDYPSPADLLTGIPTEVTKRGNTIEVYPVPTSAEAGKYVRLDYIKRPTVFAVGSLSALCDMSDADELLIDFAVSKAFKAIGGADAMAQSNLYFQYYLNSRENYREEKDGLLMAGIENLFT